MKFKSHHYKPLVEELTIQKSHINGLGLHATMNIKAGIFLGETHIWEERRWEYIRTPLGGFINHSDKPNCHRSQVRIKPGFDKWIITVIEDVNPGDELTLKYTMYDPRK